MTATEVLEKRDAGAVIERAMAHIGAIPTTDAVIPGYYWWLPACAKSVDAGEWTIVSFHPLNNKHLAGWFVGPLTPPKV